MLHNFALSEEQDMVRDTVQKLAKDQIEPVALEKDEHCQFVRESFDGLAELGLLAMSVSEENDGAGMGLMALAVATEELAKVCGSSARLLLSQAGLCAYGLDGSGMSEAAAALRDEIASGAKLAAYVGPELGIQVQDAGGSYQLSGQAAMVTAAMEADVFLVAASNEAGENFLFSLPADAVVRQACVALGFRATAPGSLDFSGVDSSGIKVAADTLLAQGDAAKAAFARSDLAACIAGGAMAVGMASACHDLSKAHAAERMAFGKALLKQQAVGLKLVDVRRRAQAARHQAYHAARLADQGQAAKAEAMMAKLNAVEAAVLAADEGVQILGGYGYTVEYHAERHYRDAKTLEVLDGGAESLRNQLAMA